MCALTAPSGVYNVGAEPVRRTVFAEALPRQGGRTGASWLAKPLMRVAGDRLEQLTRSHRVSSRRLPETTGWVPLRPEFTPSWVRTVELETT